MKYLFVHQNFPGQFVHLAPALASQPDNEVRALTMQKVPSKTWAGVQVQSYVVGRGNTQGGLALLRDLESKVIRAEAAMQAALAWRDEGFSPDVIIAHSGWGEAMFLKQVWPNAKMGLYCEFFYRDEGYDLGFDTAIYPLQGEAQKAQLQLKNAHYLLQAPAMDAGLSPTHFQADSFPAPLRSKIAVIHDGIDTRKIAPNPHAALKFGSGLSLCKGDEVVTFVSRSLEPYRGFHIFMRALPAMLRARPHAHFVVVGRESNGYGAGPAQGGTWKQRYMQEARDQIDPKDWARVKFVEHVPRAQFTQLLQLSTVHIYWTYPFVLSWSLLEAMSAGCAIVASDTAPVREAIEHGQTGHLVDFFDHQAMADAVCQLLDDAQARTALGHKARWHVQQHYDLETQCLPRMLEWVASLHSG